MTFYYDDNAGTSQFNLQDFEPTARQKLSAAVSEAWTEGYTDPLLAYKKQRDAANIGPKLSAADASARIMASGLKVAFSAKDGEYTAAQLDLMLERQRQTAMVQDVRDRTPWSLLGSPLRGAAMFGTAMADPINLATAFVPWTRLAGAPAVQSLRGMTAASSIGTRTLGRAALGAADGGISTAVLEPAYYALRQEVGDDYDAMDSMANIAFGTVLGGGIHAGGGAAVDAIRAIRARRAGGAPVVDAPNVEAPETVADVAPDVAARADQSIQPPARTADELGMPETARRNDLMAFIRDTGGLAPTLARDAGGDTSMQINQRLPGFVKNSGAENYDELTERLIEDGFLPAGMDSGSAEAIDMAADLVTRAINGERIVRIEDQIREAELQARQAFDEADRDRFEAELEARLEREAIQAENQMPPAEEVMRYVDPETREATLGAAVAQSLAGRQIDVDAIVRSDMAAGGTATEADIRAAAERNQRPEAVRTADFDAAAAVDERVATAPKWDGLADAEAAMADADTLLNDTVKAGDEAWKYSRGQKKDSQSVQVDQAKASIEQQGGKVVAAADVDEVVHDSRIPKLNLRDLIGKRIFPTIADRTAAGAIYTGIDSSQLQLSIPLLGGPLFPLRKSNLEASVVWANRGKGVTSQKAAKLKEGASYMMVVLGDANMHQSNSTVSNAFFGTLEAYARDRRITKKNAAALTDMVRNAGDADANIAAALGRFPGFDDADILTAYIDDLSFEARKRLLTVLGNKEAQNLGAPPLQKILDATREPEFAGNRWGDGVLVVEVDQQNPQVDLGTQGTQPHPDFPLGIKGRVVGRLDVPVNYELLWQDWLAKAREDAIARGTPAEKVNVRRAFELSKPIVEITEDLVGRIGDLAQSNIDSPRQAKLAADLAAGNWRTSDVAKNRGGISPQEFIDAVALSPGSATLRQFTDVEVRAAIKAGTLKLYQLGDGQAFFALEKVGDQNRIVAMVNNEQGARGLSGGMIAKAIEEGATHIEVHAVKTAKYPDGFLPEIFKSLGFEVATERPTPKAMYSGKKRNDAVQFWRQANPDLDPNGDLPPLVTLEFKNGDRGDATKRYLADGIAGFFGGRIARDVDEAVARLSGSGEQAAGAAGGADGRGAAGAEGAGGAAPVASRARQAVEAVARLTDNELRNLGLTAEDRDFAKQLLRYSRGFADASPDVERLTFALAESFGADTVNLLQRGQIQIVATPKDIPGGPHPGDVKAATAPDGTVYVVAENVSEAEARGIVLHEVGVHVGMREMLGDELFDGVLSQLDDAITRGETWAQAARAAVPADTLPAHVREEQLAYLVQNAPELPIVQRIIAAVRAWAFRTFETARERMTLTEADFRAMAVAALHHAARNAERQVGGLVPVYARQATAAEWNQRESAPVGSWVKADFSLSGSRPVYQVRELDVGGLYLPELDGQGRLQPEKRRYLQPYTEMAAAGQRPPSITVIEMEDGRLRVVDGHRRVMAARAAGVGKIRALVSPLVDTPNGKQEATLENIGFAGASNASPTSASADVSLKYARGPIPEQSPSVEQTLARYDAAVERAKAFSGVLRAAADKLDNDAQAVAAMRAALPDITEVEINELLAQLRRQVSGLRTAARQARSAITAEDTAAVLQTEAMRAADMLANNLQMAAVIERRNAALNLNARTKAQSFVNQFVARGLDTEGFYALLAGSERTGVGSRMSVDAEGKAFRSEWVGGLIADVEKLGYWEQFTSGAFDKDIYDAMYRMGSDAPDMRGLPEPAVKIAEVLHKYQSDARNTRNRFGAWIRDLKGYITRQSHDMFKLREVADRDWIDYVLPRIDLDRMQRLGLISADSPIESLRAMYDNLASGSHIEAVTDESDVVAFGSGSNLARRESVSRTLYFKDGVAAYEYNERFGQGRLADSVLFGLEHAARSAALMKTLGTNPEATLTRLMDETELSLVGDPTRRANFRASRQSILNMLKHVDGSAQIPGNVTAAKIGTFARAWMSMAKLGGALISSVTDLAGYASELRYQGDKNLLTGVADGVGRLLQGRAKGEQRQILNSLGVFHESIVGSVAARFDSPELGGKTAWAMQQFFKWNGLNWWTETLRDGAALAHSANLADNAGKAWDALPSELRRLMELYRIDAGKWDLLRMGGVMQADGRSYITPDGLRSLPRSALEAYIQQTGRTVSDASVQNLIDDLSQALRVMAIDRAHHAVLEPGARTRAFMQRGSQPGTVQGELLRYIGQFKSFSVAMIQMTLGREIYGRGYDTLGQYLRKGHGDMLGLATYIGLTAALGYAAMSVKDMLKGREPRDPQDSRTWMAAMAQGGGLGLYGDFLFGEYSRTGRTLTASLAGPVFGSVDALAELWTRIRKGDDSAAAAFKFAIDNTPFLNLFWLRPTLDYLILFQIQESLNPGFLRRMEGRIKRDNGQEFIFPPSQYAAGV